MKLHLKIKRLWKLLYKAYYIYCIINTRRTFNLEQTIDFSTITACGESCTACKKRTDGICGDFPCKQLTSYINWNKNIVKHLASLACQYYNQNFKGEKIMKITEQFEKEIAPFSWVEYKDTASVCLDAGIYLQEVFDSRADEGFEGSGYDWEGLAKVFLDEKCPELISEINFDSEAGMFCVYSKNIEALQKFILNFKNACMDKTLIFDLFSRAELD